VLLDLEGLLLDCASESRRTSSFGGREATMGLARKG